MDYLEKTLLINVRYEEGELRNLPSYMSSFYSLQRARLDSIPVVFVSPKSDTPDLAALKTHTGIIEKLEGIKAVAFFQTLTRRQREYLIEKRIPFVCENRQAYLPFMGIAIEERFNREKQKKEKILPSAQVLLLYFIYNGTGEMKTGPVSKELGLSRMTISRASQELEDKGLVETRMEGAGKVIYSRYSPRELFDKARSVLVNPVKKSVYISRKYIDATYLMSGYSALSEYSMLSLPRVMSYASESISKWNGLWTENLLDGNNQVRIDFFRYNPKLLSSGTSVDRLSLVLSLEDDEDERVEGEIEDMLDTLWRNLDAKRN